MEDIVDGAAFGGGPLVCHTEVHPFVCPHLRTVGAVAYLQERGDERREVHDDPSVIISTVSHTDLGQSRLGWSGHHHPPQMLVDPHIPIRVCRQLDNARHIIWIRGDLGREVLGQAKRTLESRQGGHADGRVEVLAE